jgi:prepilin-type N-terminal cleavage/methylation domain-containing protein
LVERLRDEAGYSLVEVIVAMMILAIAIIPMVGMFDAGLRAAVTGANYDTGRALATAELDSIRALPYNTPPSPPADSVREIYPPSGSPHSCRVSAPSGFTCEVSTAFVTIGAPGSSEIVEDAAVRTMMSVQVTVTWEGGRSYSTTGIVAK